ncbi:nuclear transport factor 2 family protein [Amycolatopsis thermoflava]|uniref:nuclear transport factor 2 family protein n=1 Tax=Amycolatopsis thermoflava TaxID=84480 RepID=UPI0036674F7B
MPDAQDQHDIIRATNTYALGLDTFDPALALSAFADGAVWDATAVGLERYEGLSRIREFFEGDAKAIARQCHILTNHLVEFVDDDHARGTNYVYSEGETTAGATFKAIALNRDTYVRTDDGWRIESRVISPLTTPEMEGFSV